MKRKKVLNIISILLVLVIIFCGYKIVSALNGYYQEKLLKESFQNYRPMPLNGENDSITNQSILDAQEKNPDIIGWLTVEGTSIDYLFVHSNDNEDYLHRDLNGDQAVAGTIFMDYQCKDDISCFNTILYGHKMKNGSMFGDIDKFRNKKFWDEHTTGYVYLAHATYQLNFFAYAVVDQYDENIYNPHKFDNEPKELIDYIKTKSRQFRDVSVVVSEKIMVLSTCNYEFDGARSILVAKLQKIA